MPTTLLKEFEFPSARPCRTRIMAHVSELFEWRFMRGSIQIVSSWDDIAEICWAQRPRTLISDVEPLALAWGARTGEVARSLASLPALPPLALVFCTNSSRFTGRPGTAEWVHRAHKPFTRRTRLGSSAGPVLVAGDLLLLDGLLAARLGADFLWFRPQPAPVPLWPRVLAALDRALAPLLLTPAVAR